MFWTVFRFELDYHRRRPSTYLFFATLFLLTFFGMASDAFLIFDNQGQVMKNAPIILAQTMAVMCAIGQTITTALMGTAILRDVQLKSHELVFTTRVTRNGYLAGRFAGACTGHAVHLCRAAPWVPGGDAGCRGSITTGCSRSG